MDAYLQPLVSCCLYYDNYLLDDCHNKDCIKPVVTDKHSGYKTYIKANIYLFIIIV